MAGLLFHLGEGEGRRGGGGRTQGSGVDPPPAPPGIDAARPLPAVEASDPSPFLAECVSRPREAVPQLRALLRGGTDVAYQPRWLFREGRLEGYPTLRAVYLAALARIEGQDATDALASALDETGSLEESCLIAWELSRRGAAGWVPAVLERCDREPDPARLQLQLAMAELSARSDPAATAQHLVERAPRGEEGKDPRVLAAALRALPLDRAAEGLAGLLEDPRVTRRAKSRYGKEMLARAEAESVARVREIVERGRLDEATLQELSQEAAQSIVFLEEIAAYGQARARGDRDVAGEIRARFLRRVDETYRLASVALGVDIASSDDLRAANVRRLLDAHRAKFDQNGAR